MSLLVLDGPTILVGESLSDSIDCTGGQIVRITVPPEYTEPDTPLMTFQVSSDGVMFNDMVDEDGKQIAITARANTSIVIDKSWTRAVGFLKLRSGTIANPSPQVKDDCKFAIAVRTESAAMGSGMVYTSDTVPADAPVNSLWWHSAEGPSAAKRLYIKYFDGNSAQWVAAEQ